MKHALTPTRSSLPNCITGLRIAGAILLVFTAPLTPPFFLVYTLCGVSDALDGWIARRTNSVSELGAKLDSVADLLFYTVMMIKIIPTLWRILPTWIWYMLGGVLLVRAASYITAAVKFKRFASLHTKLNKLTGATLFLMPYFLALRFAIAYCFTVCFIAGIASAQELLLHLRRRQYESGT